MNLRFLSDWNPPYLLALAGLLALTAWFVYWQQTKQLRGSAAWVLPTLRSVAILLIALTLAEPIVESQIREGEPGRVVFLVDGSRSMSLADQLDSNSNSASRYERAINGLSNSEQALIPQLSNAFDMSLETFGQDGTRQVLWESKQTAAESGLQALHANLQPTWADSSALGDALQQLAKSFAMPASDAPPREVVVLLSDGQSNSGVSPLDAAQSLADQNVPVFCVGYGAAIQTEDLSIQSVSLPNRVYRTDILRGVLRVAENIPQGRSYSAEVSYEGKVLWQADMVSQGQAQRELEFTLPVSLLMEAASQALPVGVTFSTLPIKLDAHVSYAQDRNTQNDTISLFTSVAAQKSKILIVDGRSRWETRYIKNLFSRDPAWDVTSVIDTGNPSDSALASFPSTRDVLFQFNLVILGDVESNRFEAQQLQWLREFVEVNAGGLIVIDGARHHLRGAGYATLHELLPIRWLEEVSAARNALPKHVVLTEAGKSLNALDLTKGATDSLQPEVGTQESQPMESNADNDLQWAALPPIHFSVQVKAEIGSEILALAVSDVDTTPLLVTRQFGSGRVLYLATDETWRWRYKVADRDHSRFWNQLARWSMRTPLSIQGEFASLDTGPPTTPLGQSVNVRCQLRETNGQAAVGRVVTAIVRRGNEIVTRIPLVENAALPGNYAANLELANAGDYNLQIEAEGFAKSALELVSKFSILAPKSSEMSQTTCNESMLRKISAISGGKYAHEDEIETFAELLQPISGGKITQSATILWQSYWWFCPAILLLVLEWILRKRSGLV